MNAAFCVYEKQGIGHAVARALYGTVLSGSVTRLEQYAACAYAHFLKYGLELEERQRYELASSDLGNLFISLLISALKQQEKKAWTGKPWRILSGWDWCIAVWSRWQQIMEIPY